MLWPTIGAGHAQLSRRNFLASGAALAGAAAFGGVDFISKASAQAKPHRIDVHHHVAPPAWVEALKKAGKSSPPVENWNIEKSLADMEKGGVATAMVSPTTPQVGFLGKEEAARVARECNEYTKKLMSDHPGRFGLFATLPLPHIDESLKEIAYVFDTLKADGIGMMTVYGDKWLGYSYPRTGLGRTQPAQGDGLYPSVHGQLLWQPGRGPAGNSGRVGHRYHPFDRQPDLFRHRAALSGHQLHLLPRRRRADRVGRAVRDPDGEHAALQGQVHPRGRREAVASASITIPPRSPTWRPIETLVKIVPVSQVVFGSDFPYRTSEEHVKGLAAHFDAADLKLIERDNALRILARLREA